MKLRRGSSLRWRQAAILVLATCGLTSASMAPSLYDYKYDGTTTYCYWMDQGMQVSNLDFAYVLEKGTGIECPLTITLQQATTGPILVGNEVEYAFTATLNLIENAFNLTELQTAVPDPTTGLPMQIGHSNIHSCSRSTVCDIFRTGANRKIVDQETSNFTSAGTADFRQKITYNSVGERNVFAHIILPPKDFLQESYHFITFVTTNVEASSSSLADSDSSGLSTGATVAMIVGGVAIVVAVILSVAFWRRKRQPGQETNNYQNSGFGLPASYVANKSKSHLDWNAEPESRLTAQGSGLKDNYSSVDQAHGSRGPGLNASALMFNERPSRQNKTVSSSGSLHSSRGQGDAYNNYDTPMQRSGNNFNSSNVFGASNNFAASGHSNRGDPYHQSKPRFPDDSMYDDGESILAEDRLEYGRTPDLETFGIGSDNQGGPSFGSEMSMGTSYDYGTEDAHYAQAPFNPLLSGYGRESETSSMGSADNYTMFEQPPSRRREDTLDAILSGDQGAENENDRPSSVSSIGTVDFTQDEPSVRSQKPITFEPLDETLTMSAIAKGQTANAISNNHLADSNSSDNSEFVLHDSSVTFAASNVSSDYASTMSSIDIDNNNRVSNKMSSVSDIVSEVAPSEHEASTSNKRSSYTNINANSKSDYPKLNYDEGSSFGSGLEGSSLGSGFESSSFDGTEGVIRSSYGANLTSYNLNARVTDQKLDATNSKNDFSNTHSTYDFDDKSFRGSNSFALSPSDTDVMTDDDLRSKSVSSADGESYEF
ncbi:hypothetical protein Plhal304r1_c035g0110031 [Plasmopara halstedii]